MSDPGNPPLTVYSPDSRIRHPLSFLGEMWRDLGASRELAWALATRDISARYRQSYFGYVWAFLPPMVTGLVFIFLNSQNVIKVGETDVAYPVFVMFGTILWQVFVDSLNAPLSAFASARGILSQTNLRYEAIFLSGLGPVFFNLGIRVLILAAVFLVFGVSVSPGVLLFPVAVLGLVLLGVTIGLFLTPVGLLYSDISHSLAIVTSFWFFITPVVYPVSVNWPFSVLLSLNPVAPLLTTARDLATKGVVEFTIPFLTVYGVTLVALFFGLVLVRLAMPIVVERMGA